QGPRGRPDPRPRRGRQLLPDQEQLPRPDVPGFGGRPDWRGGELMDRLCDPTPALNYPCGAVIMQAVAQCVGAYRRRGPDLLAMDTSCRLSYGPVLIAFISTATSRMSRRTSMSTGMISRPNSGCNHSGSHGTLGFRPRNWGGFKN